MASAAATKTASTLASGSTSRRGRRSACPACASTLDGGSCPGSCTCRVLSAADRAGDRGWAAGGSPVRTHGSATCSHGDGRGDAGGDAGADGAGRGGDSGDDRGGGGGGGRGGGGSGGCSGGGGIADQPGDTLSRGSCRAAASVSASAPGCSASSRPPRGG